MEDGLSDSFIGESVRGVKSTTNFDALRGSLTDISDQWRSKQQGATKSFQEAINNDGRAQWRRDLAEVLESTPVHVIIVTLLLVDLLATAVDILKTIHNKTYDLDTCSALLEGCHCNAHFGRSESLQFIFWVSIAILSVLALNVVGLLVAFGLHFFRHPGYVLDAFVVGTALGLEIFLDSETVGLLIILTLWRIVRVAHGIFEVTDEAWEKQIKEFEKRLEEAELKHDQDEELIREKESRIAELEGRGGGGEGGGRPPQSDDGYGYGRRQDDDDNYGGTY